MAKSLLIGLLLFSATSLFSQWDTLLSSTFNQRILFLDGYFKNSINKKDSLSFFQKTDSLLLFAQKQGLKRMELDVRNYTLYQKARFLKKEEKEVENSFKKLLGEIEDEGYKELEALAYFDFADYLWDQSKKLTLAVQYYEKSYDLVVKLSPETFICKQWIIFKIGEKYYYLNDYATALRFFEKAVAIPDNEFKSNASISIYNTMGLAYLNTKDNKMAEACYLKGLEVAKAHGIKVWIGILSGNLGNIYLQNGEIEKGKKMLRIDEKLSLDRGAKAPAAGALLRLAELSVKENEFEEAERLLDSAMLLFGGKINIYRKSALFPTLSRIYQHKGDWKKATLYLDSTLVIKDSLFRKENALRAVRAAQRVELEESRVEIAKVESTNKKKTMQLYGAIAGLLLTLGAGGVVLRQKRKTDEARKRSDELLLNILPSDVAEELKATGRAQARKFNEVTVLFSDFKSFTTMAEQMPAVELVKILDDYFRAFDKIMEEEGLEKIKTIGDAYMGVCGLPTPTENHAEKVVRAACKMQEHMQNSPYGWQLRIGIHTGPVVAGIVGIKKFAYDIWGDTVNTAARMEQNSEPGGINISKTTYEKVKEKVPCVFRGKIQAKNKGELEMYFVQMGDWGWEIGDLG